ncbi:MarR family winged helix-turn-helix transcriptional regulator [Rhizobium sp. 9140]|uniref:MarR family winged helix-turn-helix transcriptional regulator n=1 Tax=Rhizobium sp. 9140 TaxID=1761900 RepID=UPI000794A903|nr:MarR family transcriptional regulator [Rhizobium sp. 9140]CZT33725.1 DNA-binding transcriptional regulator, MarR family [Rhizobium sp. 9140]
MAYDRMESATYLASLLARGFSRQLQERGRKLGFAPGQFPVLAELWNEDGLTQRQLIDRLDAEQATIANTLARMERDGLITRRPHPTDRRTRQVFLTDRGRGLRDEAMTAARAADDALFVGFRRFERALMLEYMRMAIANSACAPADISAHRDAETDPGGEHGPDSPR